MINTKVKIVYYSSRANKHFMTKYACAKNEAKYWIMEKYKTELGCRLGCVCDYSEQCDMGYYAPSDLKHYESIHARLYKRVLKNLTNKEY